jgi:hypothetical protein
LILVLCTIEAWRTRNWKDLPGFDYLDVRHTILAASRGGTTVADATEPFDTPVRDRKVKDRLGKVAVKLHSEVLFTIRPVIAEKSESELALNGADIPTISEPQHPRKSILEQMRPKFARRRRSWLEQQGIKSDQGGTDLRRSETEQTLVTGNSRPQAPSSNSYLRKYSDYNQLPVNIEGGWI